MTYTPRFINTRLRIEDDSRGFPFILADTLTYVTNVKDLGTIVVPVGFKTDLASIPRLLWNILPPVAKWDWAAIVHDYLYRHAAFNGRPIDRGTADAVLNEAMRVLGVGDAARRAIYWGVRIGGWYGWRINRKNDGPQQAAA